MKSVSSIELRLLVKEWGLANAKIDKIFQTKKREFYIVFHVPSIGKKILFVKFPGMIYMSSSRMIADSMNYGLFLRKFIANSRLRELRQIGSERVLEFVFEKKERFRLIIELFSKGNMILCRDDYKIISPLESQEWKDRVIRPGKQYIFPKQRFNYFDIDEKEFKDKLLRSTKDSVVTFLASDIGLGGVYAEEICAGFDKEKKPRSLSDKEIDDLLKRIKLLIDRKPEPVLVDSDVYPFLMKAFSGKDSKKFSSLNSAFDAVYTKARVEEKAKADVKEQTKGLDKLDKIIKSQKAALKKLEKGLEENQRKGELIYENYQFLEKLFLGYAEAKKLNKIKEYFSKIKDKRFKEFREGKIVVEL